MDIRERRRELSAFYDAAATSFESGYRLSTRPGSHERRYNAERMLVQQRVGNFGSGRLADIGAGTGYWISKYLANVDHATLIEPSEGMFSELTKKIQRVDPSRVESIYGDHSHTHGRIFDSILMSSVLGHYPFSDQKELLTTVSRSLKPGGELLVIDSVWNGIAKSLHPGRVGYAVRNIDGQPLRVYKHYFERSEVGELISAAELVATEVHFGTYFWFCSCRHKKLGDC